MTHVSRWASKSNAQLIAEGRMYASQNPHREKCMCGLCIYERLYTAQTLLQCQCEIPYWIFTSKVDPTKYWGTFCYFCGKPHYTSLSFATYECEGCGKFTYHDYREGPFPVGPKLCRSCDVPVTIDVHRRSKFRID